jgi:hypothetical protein
MPPSSSVQHASAPCFNASPVCNWTKKSSPMPTCLLQCGTGDEAQNVPCSPTSTAARSPLPPLLSSSPAAAAAQKTADPYPTLETCVSDHELSLTGEWQKCDWRLSLAPLPWQSPLRPHALEFLPCEKQPFTEEVWALLLAQHLARFHQVYLSCAAQVLASASPLPHIATQHPPMVEITC